MATSTILRRPQSSVYGIVSAASQRHYFAVAVEQLPWALTAFLTGTALLLVLGTHYLHPFWLLFFAAVGLGIAGARMYARRTSRYRIAQLLDRRLQLHDSLSTAWYILGKPEAATPATWAAQVESAESLAQSIDPRTAFPVHFRRLWFIPATLLVLCCTLLAFRWGRVSTLDLRRPLVPPSLQALLGRTEAEADETLKAQPSGQPSANADLQLPNLPSTPPSDKPSSSTQASPSADAHGGPGSLADAKPDGRPPSSPASPESSAGTKSDPSQKSSVLDRMKDALGGVMSKLEQAVKPKDASGQKNAKDGQKSGDDDTQASQDAAKDRSEKASSKSDKPGESSKGESNSEAQAVEKNQPGQAGDSSSSNDQHGTNAQSGAGRNDGRKDMQDAAQLKAIGKLAEIIGKRSASLTGDMTVEKPSGAQQLKTQYSNHNAAHSDAGGDINHDQIPLEYRDFIRTYMQEVHQNPSPATKPAPPTH